MQDLIHWKENMGQVFHDLFIWRVEALDNLINWAGQNHIYEGGEPEES